MDRRNVEPEEGTRWSGPVTSEDCLSNADPLYSSSKDADFVHSARRTLPRRGRTAFDAYADLAAVVPAWFDALMRVRNAGMKAVGMKDLGSLGAVSRNAPVLPGHRAGIFTVLSSDADCLLMEDNDRHLRVQLALRWDSSLNQDELIISTVVHVHNAFGRAYMVPVAPTHRLIMPLLLGRLGRQ